MNFNKDGKKNKKIKEETLQKEVWINNCCLGI